ncbi:hypothetical protein [Pseudomonas arsenicoxydans]|uniref:Uncharacterized protein n=1 Tax=Pseudomonas arsenicoxydans TaxID=702115 RepID=A0A502HTW9_9PSED|nr:hypothetical protein [Pseudomonas arsenicoxydans]TPG77355.1 hypothetical protein EAH78_14250 [Pseudomonas arsenicoxydans]
MSRREGHERNDPLAALNLPQALGSQALRLLGAIEQARTKTEAWRAADRAEGFTLGVETLRALNPADIEALYMAFDQALQLRLLELEQ